MSSHIALLSRHITLCGLLAGLMFSPAALATPHKQDVLLITQFSDHHLALVTANAGVVHRIKVGRAPFGVVTAENNRAYVTTGEGLAIVDVKTRERLALLPYQTKLGGTSWGEYRDGGMGIAMSADGNTLAVGVNRSRATGVLEVYRTKPLRFVDSIEVGKRPFQVLFSHDGEKIFTLDHDSYSVTEYTIATDTVKTHEVAPLGYAAFDKPHYAVMSADGLLWLPIQGRLLLGLNPNTGQHIQRALSANTHQHGIALDTTGKQIYIVGSGPAGSARGKAALTRISLDGSDEQNLALTRQHEHVLLSTDGTTAYLTGGQSYTGGWNGISVIDLSSGAITEIDVPGQPLGIALML